MKRIFNFMAATVVVVYFLLIVLAGILCVFKLYKRRKVRKAYKNLQTQKMSRPVGMGGKMKTEGFGFRPQFNQVNKLKGLDEL